jgi:hypothetical protein
LAAGWDTTLKTCVLIASNKGAMTMAKPFTARRAAIKLIEKYVWRGDSLADIRNSGMGHACHDCWADIGGYIRGKRIGPDWIVITKLNGRPYTAKFKLEDIYRSIKRGATCGNCFNCRETA